MHNFIFILASFISGVICGTTVSTKDDFLAVIRQDLRRNNDDYVESTISQTSEPSKPSITSQVLPVGTKSMQTTKNVKTTENIKTIKKSSPFRRVFISSEILPIDDKPKHRQIKIDPSQFLMTIRKIPEAESKKQTRFTRTYETNDMSRKNGLHQSDRKAFKQKTNPSAIWEKTKGSDNNEEFVKLQALMDELEKKDKFKETEATPKSGTGQGSKQELITQTNTQTKADQKQKMGLVMSKLLEGPPMVMPLREKAPVTFDEPSIEELQEPWEIPRLETTRGVFNRVGLKSRDSGELPILRAMESKDTNKPINKLQVVTKVNKNKALANKLKPETKNVVRTDRKLRQNYEQKRINELKLKMREGLKLSSLPPGDLLDLWPARGPMVHAMRLKNRLCQRSVLLNEGPKYDSKGSTYMPRFKPRFYGAKKVIDFHQTKSPILVLPRCCNCCRKSVLGCE